MLGPIKVTLTCREDWYPRDSGNTTSLSQSPSKRATCNLRLALPELLTTDPEELFLSADTLAETVEVNLTAFHILAVNVPHVRVSVGFPENGLDVRQQTETSYVIAQRLSPWLNEHTPWARPHVHLEVYWVQARSIALGHISQPATIHEQA